MTNLTCEPAAAEKIEILGLDMFETHREEIKIIETFNERFNVAMGWHYYLDIAWILRAVHELPPGSLLFDAGAGSGILQFILAESGYNVISADFMGRDFSQGFAKRYESAIYSLNSQKNSIYNSYTHHLKNIYFGNGNRLLEKLSNIFKGVTKTATPLSCIHENKFVPGTDASRNSNQSENIGRIFLYKCDIGDMPLLPDGFVDGVVSLSALEHNSHDGFEKCVNELLRIIKPSGRIWATVSAAQVEDHYHDPSKGWCYSEATLKKLFKLSERVSSNFLHKSELFKALREEGNELHRRLDPVYFKSGNNGMPWGKWDPQYQPVAIVKVKS